MLLGVHIITLPWQAALPLELITRSWQLSAMARQQHLQVRAGLPGHLTRCAHDLLSSPATVFCHYYISTGVLHMACLLAGDEGELPGLIEGLQCPTNENSRFRLFGN
jgi:hypothetical protein